MSRRSFLSHLGVAGICAPAFIRNLLSAPPSGKVRLASFGAGGMAWDDLSAHLAHPAIELVAVAEVDSSRLDKLSKRDPDKRVRIYKDWRQLLEKEAKSLDAVSVGTPDHMHAPIGISAMQLGLHAYIQKPLAQNLFETRRLTEVAREQKVVTQMGIQIHSSGQYRTAVQWIQGGVVGKIREVHTWSNKKWGDSAPPPTQSDAVPAELDWDLWLGVAPQRPFVKGAYHPGAWRKRLDFGTGTFGDMGCHIYDPVFQALGVTAPLRVRSEGAAPNAWSWASDAIIHYEFPGTPYTAGETVKVTWYDGDRRPSAEIQALLEGNPLPAQGSIFIGTQGVLLLPHIGWPQLFPSAPLQAATLERAQTGNHHAEFIDAILGKGTPHASFDYAGPLTEAVLLGGVATFYPQTTLEWDRATLRFKNHPDANRLVKRTYREGWSIPGLS